MLLFCGNHGGSGKESVLTSEQVPFGERQHTHSSKGKKVLKLLWKFSK